MFLLCVSWRNARNLWIQERQPRFVWFCLMMVLLLLRLGMVNGFQSLFSSCHRRIKLPQVAVVGLKSSSSQWLDEFLDTIIHKNNSTAITPRATSLEKQKFESKGNDASLGWRRMVWGTESTVPPAAEILPSPVDIAVIRDRVVFIKRDDQVGL